MVWKKKNWTIRIGGSRRTAEPEEKPENNITEAVTTESGEKMTASNIAESDTSTEMIDQRVSEALEESTADVTQTLPAAETAPAETAEPAADSSCGDQESGGKTAGGKASLDSLEPADVFGFFRQISAIPHGSFHTEAISDYLENFAKERGLDYIRDELGNLIITKPAAAGCEDAEPIALQGHVDMVCEKEEYVDNIVIIFL